MATTNPFNRVTDKPTLGPPRLAEVMPEEALGRDAIHGNGVTTRKCLVECGKEPIMQSRVGREQRQAPQDRNRTRPALRQGTPRDTQLEARSHDADWDNANDRPGTLTDRYQVKLRGIMGAAE